MQDSGVGAVIYEELIPLSQEARSVREALVMGEDFELLFTLPLKEARKLLCAKPKGVPIPLSLIGEIRDKKFGLLLITRDGQEKKLTPEGFRHF
jgi:thiamine monophosphate kinase